MSVDIQALSDAWKSGGTPACADLLGVPQQRAASIVSNMRRNKPDMFPLRASGRPRTHKAWRIREAIRLIQEGQPMLAIPLLEHCLESLDTRNKGKQIAKETP